MKLAISFALLAFPVASPAALAAGADFHTGTFGGRWCNYYATYDIQRQEPHSWVFYGRLYLHSTGQNDEIRVEQRADDSLSITRFQPDGHPDDNQTALIFRRSFVGGYYNFSGPGAGYGCNGTNVSLSMPPA